MLLLTELFQSLERSAPDRSGCLTWHGLETRATSQGRSAETQAALQPTIEPSTLPATAVAGVTEDSRQVQPGYVFVARGGLKDRRGGVRRPSRANVGRSPSCRPCRSPAARCRS